MKTSDMRITTLAPRAGHGLFLTLLLLLIGAVGATAQTLDPSTPGTSYILAFPDTTTNTADPREAPFRWPRHDTLLVAIYSEQANTVTITGDGGRTKQLTLAAGGFQTVALNDTAQGLASVADEVGAPSNKTFRIDAAQPVVVYCFMHTAFGTEAFTPAPVSAWGRTYYAAAHPGEVLYDLVPSSTISYAEYPKAGPAEILVIASEDNTVVTITPNGRLEGAPPTSVTLQRNQCYQIQSWVDTNSSNLGAPQPDLGGSYITASKPIGVISGNTRAQVLDIGGGLAKNVFKNMTIEWLTPTEQQGTEFVYLPTWDSFHPTGQAGEHPEYLRQGEVVRVYGTTGSPGEELPTVTGVTEVDGQGTTSQHGQARRSGFYEELLAAPVARVFTTDRPAQAFMTTTATIRFIGLTGGESAPRIAFDGVGTYMVEMTPREQWPSVAPYYVPGMLGSTEHYLNIVADSATLAGIRVNGQLLADLRPITGTEYYWTSKKLTPEDRGLIAGASADARFYAFIYGNHVGTESFASDSTRKDAGHYLESLGHMYGYPLAPRRLALHPAGVETGSGPEHNGRTLTIDPNPPAASASIRFYLEAPGRTTVQIFNAMGTKVTTLADGVLGEGPHTLRWDTAGIPSGMYYCRITAGALTTSRSIVVAR